MIYCFQFTKIPVEKRNICLFTAVVESFVVRLRECHAMTMEEHRSYLASIAEITNTNEKKGGNQEWHKRLIAATQIQRQEAEKTLTQQEAEYWKLSRGPLG